MNCNICQKSPCCCNTCYRAVPSSICQPVYNPCPPAPCPNPPFPFNGIYTQFTRVVTTNLEFFNMPATPKTLIPAPGPGKLIVPLQIWNSITVSNPPIPYATIIPSSVTLTMNLGGTNLVTDLSILGSLVDTTVYYTQFSGSVPSNLSNQPLTLSTISQPVVGDSVLYSYIIYTIISI